MNCKDCESFERGICTIRYIIFSDGTRKPMLRKPSDKACQVFMLKLSDDVIDKEAKG
jgi:hypothetical protein